MDTTNQQVPIGVWGRLLLLFAAIYIAVLPMANTMALRNVALLAVLVLLAFVSIRVPAQWWLGISSAWLIPLALWVAYLCLFPLIAEDSAGAWRNLGQIWYRSILALVAGAGVAVVLARYGGLVTTFHVGLLTVVPLVIHLGLVAFKAYEISGIPWNYWGRETHHADLGYAAGHAVVLFAVSAALALKRERRRLVAFALIAAAILSVTIAHSRGGLGFALLGLFLVFAVDLMVSDARKRTRYIAILVAGVAAIVLVVVFASRSDDRWVRMADRLAGGFYGDALQIQCEGNAQIERELTERFGPGQQTADLVESIRAGDGARIVLVRAGLRLAELHPWGLDGSRQAYQLRLKEYCPNPAAFQISHTHNGWLDTVLSLGWIGAGLYLLVLVNFLRLGIKGLRTGGEGIEWAYVLVVLSIFWILRGLTDSVYRDHQLEMQGFVLAYAAVALQLRSRPKLNTDTTGHGARV